MFSKAKMLAIALDIHAKILTTMIVVMTSLSSAFGSNSDLFDAPAYCSAMEYQAKQQRRTLTSSSPTDTKPIRAPLLSEGLQLTYTFPTDLNEYILDFVSNPHDLSKLALLNRSFCLWASERILSLETIGQRYHDDTCNSVTDGTLPGKLKRRSNLRVLSASGCYQLTESVLLKTIQEHRPALVALNLSGCQITNAGLDALVSALPYLSVLCLQGCDKITGEGFGNRDRIHRALKAIDLSGVEINDTTLEQFVIRFPSLTSLDIHGSDRRVTGAGIEALAARVPGLKSLNLGGCEKLETDTLKTISESFYDLMLLDITACGLVSDNLKEDDDVKRLIAALPNLKLIVSCDSIKLGSSITDAYLLQYIHSYEYALSYLDLSSCLLLTEETLIKVLLKFSIHLNVLNFYGCDQITDKTLEVLSSRRSGRGRSQLRSINIEGCNKITEKGLDAIRASYPKVQIYK